MGLWELVRENRYPLFKGRCVKLLLYFEDFYARKKWGKEPLMISCYKTCKLMKTNITRANAPLVKVAPIVEVVYFGMFG